MRFEGENLKWKDGECCIKLTSPNYKELQFCGWKDVNGLKLQIIVFVSKTGWFSKLDYFSFSQWVAQTF